MSIANIISLFGGVAMFLFGMSLMGDGLKKVAGKHFGFGMEKAFKFPVVHLGVACHDDKYALIPYQEGQGFSDSCFLHA